MNTDAAFALIDELSDSAVAALERLVAIPSLASRPTDLRAAAEVVLELAEAAGMAGEIWDTPGAPVVFARRDAPPGALTVLFYGHYDVQPADPVDAWEIPPFEPLVRDGALWGRGAGDNKGQFLAHIVAMQALQRSGGCPVGVELLIEGEEEIGSPNLADTLSRHRQALACDLALTADGPYHRDGRPAMIFGVRGLLHLELRARGTNRDVHSGNLGGLVPSPAWQLVHALARLRDADGTVRVPGFNQAVRPPSPRERELMAKLPFDAREVCRDLGIPALAGEAEKTPWETLMFRPNLNISGISTGFVGPGSKTIVPCEATARIEVRLVPEQDPTTIETLIRQQLADDEIQVERLAAVPPSSTPISTPFAEPVAAGLEAATGLRPWLQPRLGGTTPDYVFSEVLGLPSLLIPYGPPDMNHHAPNEKLWLRDLRRGTRSSAAICLSLAETETNAG